MKILKQVIILFIVYLLVAIPFKVMGIIPGFTDIRPVTMLGPIYAVFFGIPGCSVMAAGNLVMDIISGGLRWSSIGGCVANFLGPLLIYLFWVHWSKEPFSLRRGKNLLKHVGIICAAAVLAAVIITPMVALVYPEVDFWLFMESVLINHSAFPIVFGIPTMILMQEELNFKPLVKKKKDLK